MCNCKHCVKRFCEADILGHLHTFVECMAFDDAHLDGDVCSKDCCEYEDKNSEVKE